MARAVYSLRNIEKHYSREWKMKIPELEVFEGEILCIVGPNGSGKSTLLRLLHFLEDVDRGEIVYQGQKMTYPVPLSVRRDITMVFQKPIMFRGSVRQNVSYGQVLQGNTNSKEIDDFMAQLDLSHLSDASAKSLSGGEVQRVALGRALTLKTSVLLLDEPVANLDPDNVVLIETIIKQLQETNRTTIVLVTHNIAQANRLADRVAFLLDGQLIEVKPAADFFRRPSDPRSRAYIQNELTF